MPTHATPPFTITPAVLSLVAEIAGEVGNFGALTEQINVPKQFISFSSKAYLKAVSYRVIDEQ